VFVGLQLLFHFLSRLRRLSISECRIIRARDELVHERAPKTTIDATIVRSATDCRNTFRKRSSDTSRTGYFNVCVRTVSRTLRDTEYYAVTYTRTQYGRSITWCVLLLCNTLLWKKKYIHTHVRQRLV